MSIRNQASSRRRLADMATPVEADRYVPPPESACEVFTTPVPLGDDGLHRFVWCQWVYRGRVVHFSVEQQTRNTESGEWLKVRRIDTSHGSVHEHWFTARDQDAASRGHVPIPSRGWDFVDQQFSRALALCNDEAESHLERWSS